MFVPCATPAWSSAGARVLKGFRPAPRLRRISPSPLLDGAAAHRGAAPKACRAAGPPAGAAAQARWEPAWPEAQGKGKLLFPLICAVFNVAGVAPFAFPRPAGLGRRRPPVLPSSVLRCLTAGEFRLVLSSAFRLFQVYRPMHAWSGFGHVSSSPAQKRRKRHSSRSHGNISGPNELPFLIFLLDSNKIHFVLIFLFSLILFLLFSVSAYLVLCPSTEGQ